VNLPEFRPDSTDLSSHFLHGLSEYPWTGDLLSIHSLEVGVPYHFLEVFLWFEQEVAGLFG
jgi:hypothetical protein